MLDRCPIEAPSKPENASLYQAHEVSSILHSLIKEGALRTNIPKLSVLVGRWLRERHHLSSGPMNYRPPGRLAGSQPIREVIQRSLKGAAADTVCNMGPGTSLDTIIKKFSIIYGNVKSYDC